MTLPTSTRTFAECISLHEQWIAAEQTAELLQTFYQQTPKAMMVTGNAGTGKTRFAEEQKALIKQRFPDAIVPVVSLDATATLSIKAVMTNMLIALGSPSPSKGNTEHKEIEVTKLLKSLGTRLIIIDEVQDWLPKRGVSPSSKVYKFFKAFLNREKIPMLFLGLEGSVDLFADNQLKDRFLPTVEFTPFNAKTENELIKFGLMLDSLLDILPLNNKAVRFIIESKQQSGAPCHINKRHRALLLRFLLATQGLMRRVKDLLCHLELDNPKDTEITQELLCVAFERVINDRAFGNPFLPTIPTNTITEHLKKAGLCAK